jgi:uncharacterized damage-inducible protein DinB
MRTTEDAMKMTELFLAELDRSVDATRRTLERVPDGKADWKPHPKSMALGKLAQLVANLPGWTAFIVNQDSLDLANYKAPELRTSKELVFGHAEAVAASRAALANTTDEHLLKTWQLLLAGKVVSEDPRHIVLRDAVFSHLAHHRGQLTVYLRLLDVPVPAIYGPSADEGRF